VCFFVGARLSRAAGYPGWKELMEMVVREVTQSNESARQELMNNRRRKICRGRESVPRNVEGSRFGALLEAQLAKAVLPPEATHRAIVRTPYAAIVTTNFDTLLKDAYALWSDEGVAQPVRSSENTEHCCWIGPSSS
jgi:hypothetical protein